MPKKATLKASHATDDYAIDSMKEVRSEIQAIGNRATLILIGYLVAIIIALASFVFRDLSISPDGGDIINVLKSAILAFFILYLLAAGNIFAVLMFSFVIPNDDFEKKLSVNSDRLSTLRILFRSGVIYTFLSLIYAFGFVIYYLYA